MERAEIVTGRGVSGLSAVRYTAALALLVGSFFAMVFLHPQTCSHAVAQDHVVRVCEPLKTSSPPVLAVLALVLWLILPAIRRLFWLTVLYVRTLVQVGLAEAELAVLQAEHRALAAERDASLAELDSSPGPQGRTGPQTTAVQPGYEQNSTA